VQIPHKFHTIPHKGANHREGTVLPCGSTGKRDKEHPLFHWLEGNVISGTWGGTAKIAQIGQSKAQQILPD